MSKFVCPKCGKGFELNYFAWILKTIFHRFNFKEWKDYRKTKCPHCGEKSYIKRLK